jgi:hypothetical protein
MEQTQTEETVSDISNNVAGVPYHMSHSIHDHSQEGWDTGCQSESHQTYDLVQITLTTTITTSSVSHFKTTLFIFGHPSFIGDFNETVRSSI